jgi:hypothetical protein
MQIKIKGEMSIAEIRQAIFEKIREAGENYGVRYSRGATLFINPTNGFGEEVMPRNEGGRIVNKLYSEGPYKSAADDYKL